MRKPPSLSEIREAQEQLLIELRTATNEETRAAIIHKLRRLSEINLPPTHRRQHETQEAWRTGIECR